MWNLALLIALAAPLYAGGPALPDAAATARVKAFYEALPIDAARREGILMELLERHARRRGDAPGTLGWIQGTPPRTTKAGLKTVPEAVLAEPLDAELRSLAPSETVTASEAAERGRLALSAARDTDFDGSAARRNEDSLPGLSLSWGSAPRATVHARNIQSLYGLYAAGSDGLLKGLKIDGPAARLVKSPVDLFLGQVGTLAGHELGHFEYAWLGGAKDVAYVPAPGPYAFGRITEVGADDWAKMSPAARQAFYAGGVQASQAAAAQLRRDLFERGEAHWSQWPLLFFQKLDITQYALNAPKPSTAGTEDQFNDMTNYARQYGDRSGRGGAAVHADIVRGALWNALDPLGVYALWGYARRYVLAGEERQSVPGVELGGRAWMAGTGFWLSETGPRYSLSLLSRGRGGDLLEVTPTWGEGQSGLGASYSDRLAPEWRGRAGMNAWRQRTASEPGPLRAGGAVELGLRRELARSLYLDAAAGYKTNGAMLGQSQDEGAFWTLSIGGALR